MTANTFLQGINYLKACYVNWQFDLNNDLALKVWAKKFEYLDDVTFMAIIEKYTEQSKFPPQSPAELLDVLRDEISKSELNSHQAWQTVVDLIGRYGFSYHRDEIYDAIKDKPALYRAVRDFESELRFLAADDTFTPERFKRTYEMYLKRESEDKTSALIGAPNRALLRELSGIGKQVK